MFAEHVGIGARFDMINVEYETQYNGNLNGHISEFKSSNGSETTFCSFGGNRNFILIAKEIRPAKNHLHEILVKRRLKIMK